MRVEVYKSELFISALKKKMNVFLKERFLKSSGRRNISWNIQQCPGKERLTE
jgi:hypothetical protein